MRVVEWLRRHHRLAVATVTILLGVFFPLPGYFAASLFWPAGIHDLDTTRKVITFVVFVIGVSGMVWGVLAHALLPRARRSPD